MSEKKSSTGPLRVLQVIGAMGRGGAETMIMNLYRHMDRKKIQFDFLLSAKKVGEYEKEILEMGGRIYRIRHFSGKNPISYYNACRAFFRAHPEYSIVHGHIGSSAALYLRAAKKAGCFTIAHSHNGKPALSLHSVVYSFYSRPTRYIADQLFGCSTEAGIARYGKKAVRSGKYKNFKNGIDLGKFYFEREVRDFKRRELGIPADAVVVGTVGRITEQKNPARILEIFAELAKKHENCICLWIGDGSEKEQIRRDILTRHLQEKVRLLGVREDVPQLLAAMDSFLFPSLWEGLPVSIIEAQASGLPVILADTVSREVEITPLLTFLSLSETNVKWAEMCYGEAISHQNRRDEYTEMIKKSGYDIRETAKELGRFYLSHARR